jgi:hypothetical protein
MARLPTQKMRGRRLRTADYRMLGGWYRGAGCPMEDMVGKPPDGQVRYLALVHYRSALPLGVKGRQTPPRPPAYLL